jgi:hypothetical protein
MARAILTSHQDPVMKPNFMRVAFFSTAFFIGGCASTQPPKESGFLGNYSELHSEDVAGGGTRLVYANPAFTPENYNAIWLMPVSFYPEPQPTAQVSMATLNDVRGYLDLMLRDKIGQQVKLTDKPGPGVARVRVAITAVGTETQSLKVYQYIPIALVLTGAKAAIEGGMPQDATIAIETQVTDSVSGKLLYAAVRGGTGEKIQKATQGQGGVQPQSLKPLIDTWATGAATQVGRYVQSK